VSSNNYLLLGLETIPWLTGVAVGTGELEEDTYKELARVKRELEDSSHGLTRAQDEIQELRARLTWLESQASAV
jgi:voltage-gated hydrogen channel 1